MWSLLYHYRGQQQTTELFSMTEGMFNIPSKQGSRERPAWDLRCSAVRERLSHIPASLGWEQAGWESLREAWMLSELSPSPGDSARPDIDNSPNPRATIWELDHMAASCIHLGFSGPFVPSHPDSCSGSWEMDQQKAKELGRESRPARRPRHSTTLPARTRERGRGRVSRLDVFEGLSVGFL